jgi:acyl-coenzyme A thioesterase 13
LKLVKAEVLPNDPNRAVTVFELKAIPTLCNGTGNLHGGAVALIFDMCTSMTVAPVARKGFWDTGHVSRTLNCTYLRPIKMNEDCLVESEIMHLGKQMGMVRGVIKRKSDGAICYSCEHGKAAYNHSERVKEWETKKSSKL